MEVLVALTIVGVGVALAIPRVSRVMTQTRVQRAAQAMQVELQQAFAIAARNRAPTQIRWDGSSTQLRITNLGATRVYRRLGVGAGGGYGLESSDVTVNPAILTVFPGGLAADTLTIRVSKSGYSRNLWMSKSGIVKFK